VALAAGGLAAWGLFEAQWVARRLVEVPLPGLPPALDGLRIGHLSDPHLGSISLNGRAFRKAVGYLRDEQPDIVAVTGDLLARAAGERALMQGLGELPAGRVFAVLGNVDVDETRDPFSGPARLAQLGAAGSLLEDASATVEARGCRIQVVGCAAESRWQPPVSRADTTADLRILLAHFPDTAAFLPPGAFQLVLAGHTHGGQICLPAPGGKLHLSELRPPFRPGYPEGVFRLPQTTLVVSRGIGTTFVPFRFLSRPEASVLVLRRA
jgi:predicted MPP superfamily phosphohydrolase